MSDLAESNAAEHEPMPAERLAWLRSMNEPLGDHQSSLTADEVGELLAEVDRAQSEVAVAWADAAIAWDSAEAT